MIILITYLILFVLMYVVKSFVLLNKRFIRFVLTGIANTLNYVCFFKAITFFLDYATAHIIAFLLSAFVSYFITSYYTFESSPTLKSFLKFPLTFLPNLVGSTLITILLVENDVVSNNIASTLVMLSSIPITFLISTVIFRKGEK